MREKTILLDNHLSEFPDGVLSKINPEQIIKSFKDCGFDSVLFQAKCHWGNAYYDTKIGHKHKFLKFDLIKAIEEETKKHGMDLSLYYSVRWDEYAWRNNPSWRSIDSKGNYEPGPPTRWRWLCFNSPYRDYTFSQIEELVKNYDFKRLFLDILHYYYLCYCSSCKKLWKKKNKEEMPVVISEETLIKLYEFRIDIINDYLMEIRNIIKCSGKSIGITHNVGVPNTYNDYVFREADVMSSNFFRTGLWIEYELAIAGGKPVEISLSFDNPGFGGKTKEQMVCELASSYSRPIAGVLIYGNSDVQTGFFDEWTLNKLKSVYELIDPLMKLRKDIRPYSEIGLVFSNFEVETSAERLNTDPIGENPLNIESCGAYKFLTEEHLPFRLVCEDILEEKDLKDLKVLIIANVHKIRRESARIIMKFLNSGGKLLLTGDSNIIGELGYFRLGKHFIPPKGVFVDGYFLKTLWDIEIKELDLSYGHWELKENEGFESFANLVEPCVKVEGEIWDSHGTRWGNVTDRQAIICKSIGKGKLVYFNHLPFTEYIQRGARRFGEVIKLSLYKIGYKPKVKTCAPKTIETVYSKSGGKYIVFLINCPVTRPFSGLSNNIPCVDIADTIKVSNVSIETLFPIKSAIDINGKRLKIKSKGEIYVTNVPDVEQVQVVVFK